MDRVDFFVNLISLREMSLSISLRGQGHARPMRNILILNIVIDFSRRW